MCCASLTDLLVVSLYVDLDYKLYTVNMNLGKIHTMRMRRRNLFFTEKWSFNILLFRPFVPKSADNTLTGLYRVVTQSFMLCVTHRLTGRVFICRHPAQLSASYQHQLQQQSQHESRQDTCHLHSSLPTTQRKKCSYNARAHRKVGITVLVSLHTPPAPPTRCLVLRSAAKTAAEAHNHRLHIIGACGGR